jgi:hypothetical protein
MGRSPRAIKTLIKNRREAMVKKLALFSFALFIVVSVAVQAQQANIISLAGDNVIINKGERDGVKSSMTGRFFYSERTSSGTSRNIYVAKFVVKSVSQDSSEAQVVQITEDIKTWYMVEFDQSLVPPKVVEQPVPPKPARVVSVPAPLPKPRKTEAEIEKDYARFMESGAYYFNRFDYPSALEQYQKALDEKPGNRDAQALTEKVKRIIRGDTVVLQEMRVEPRTFMPYSQNTSIHFTLSGPSSVKFSIKPSRGYTDLYSEKSAASSFGRILWSGFDAHNKILSDGRYEYTLEAEKSGGAESSLKKTYEIKVYAPYGTVLREPYKPEFTKFTLNGTVGMGILFGLVGLITKPDEGVTWGDHMLFALGTGAAIGFIYDIITGIGVGPHNRKEKEKEKEVEEYNRKIKDSVKIEQTEIK